MEIKGGMKLPIMACGLLTAGTVAVWKGSPQLMFHRMVGLFLWLFSSTSSSSPSVSDATYPHHPLTPRHHQSNHPSLLATTRSLQSSRTPLNTDGTILDALAHTYFDPDAPVVDAPTALIFSDRLEGIIPTIGSMVRSTSVPMHIILIGKEGTNAEAYAHFGDRTASFVTLTFEEAAADLTNQGLYPIWNWEEWHSSVDAETGGISPEWTNENTIHVAEWDGLGTHAHQLNHLRFYIPYLSVVKDANHVFFIDDDLLVQKDLFEVSRRVAEEASPSAGLTCPCNIWMWNDDCHHFDFKSKHANILEVSPLYGGRPECTDDDDEFCLPKNFGEFVRGATPEGIEAEDQTGMYLYTTLQMCVDFIRLHTILIYLP